ncbi:hypothetical protein TNIN_88091 [Trichonephila inaurata madagascariensis]|uniref:Uncharacterized protein n=1 Tax=Trichonephila inaurata madagascariensis TaxID=2747483 RepID=A0A8X7CS83_9ARAC|nr:hypothetical protein TNIN_88091 [Trichonephila inaurata madagascariensis]
MTICNRSPGKRKGLIRVLPLHWFFCVISFPRLMSFFPSPFFSYPTLMPPKTVLKLDDKADSPRNCHSDLFSLEKLHFVSPTMKSLNAVYLMTLAPDKVTR